MKFNMLPLFVLLCSFGCSDDVTQETASDTPQERRAKRMAKADLHIHQSVKIADTDYYIYPISASSEEQNKYYFYGSSSGDYENRTWNIAFYNYKTGETHYLIKEDIIPLIEEYPQNDDFEYLNELELERTTAEKVRVDKLFFEIRMEDFNKDGLLDRADPIGLYMSDLDGSHLERISPANLSVWKWKFLDDEKRKIELRCTEETDGEERFTNHDKPRLLIVHLDSLHLPPVELFPDATREQLKGQYIDGRTTQQ